MTMIRRCLCQESSYQSTADCNLPREHQHFDARVTCHIEIGFFGPEAFDVSVGLASEEFSLPRPLSRTHL